MNRYFSVTSFLLLFFVVAPAIALGWQGMVVGVSDGDTITVLHDGKGVRIKLYGIDTPEKRQSFGKTAKQFTSVMAYGKTVDVETKGIDPYNRFVALVNVSGKSLNEALVKNGYAWIYQKYCIEAFCKDWLKLEINARYDKIGLWSEPNPVPPWEFRPITFLFYHAEINARYDKIGLWSEPNPVPPWEFRHGKTKK